jgi:hypothetical protein
MVRLLAGTLAIISKPLLRSIFLLLLVLPAAFSQDNRGTIRGWVAPKQAGNLIVCAWPNYKPYQDDCVLAIESKESKLTPPAATVKAAQPFAPRFFNYTSLPAPEEWRINATQAGYTTYLIQHLDTRKTVVLDLITLSPSANTRIRASLRSQPDCLMANLGFPPIFCKASGLPTEDEGSWSIRVTGVDSKEISGAHIRVACKSEEGVVWPDYSIEIEKDGTFAVPKTLCMSDTKEKILLVVTADDYEPRLIDLAEWPQGKPIELSGTTGTAKGGGTGRTGGAGGTAQGKTSGAAPGSTAGTVPGSTARKRLSDTDRLEVQSRGRVELTEASRRAIFADIISVTLPLPGIRTFDSLALLSPGVLPPPATNGVPGPGISATVGTAGQFTVNGLRSRDNNFTIDGSDDNEEDVGVRRQGFVALIPQPIESVDEFQIVTVLGDARFGRNIGGMINVLSKSGSPEFHGTIYSFLNDRRFNARNFFDFTGYGGPVQIPLIDAGGMVGLDGHPLMVENPGSQTAPYTRIQSGLVLGGPLKPTDKTPHTFFFTSFEKQNINARQESSFAVPTVSERGIFGTGDTGFSKVGATRIPMTPDSLPGNAIFSLYPFPNNPSGPFGPNTYTTALPADAGAVVGSVKLDHYFNAFGWTNALTGRYNITDESSVLPVTGGAIDSSIEPKLRTQNLAFFLDTMFSNNTAQIIRLSYGRTSSHFDAASQNGFLPSQALPNTPFLLNAPLLLNVTNPNSSAPNYVSASSATGSALLRSLGYGAVTGSEQITGPLGQVNIAGFSPVGVDVFNFPQTNANNTFQWADTITHVHGRHTITGGFDIRRIQLNNSLNRNARPLVQFGGLLNPNGRMPLVNNQTCSVSEPSCILSQGVLAPATLAAAGVPTGFFQTLSNGSDTSLGVRFTELDFFLQDALFVTSTLSVTAGLRYELNTVPHTVDNILENAFDPNALYQEALQVQTLCPARCNGLADYFNSIPNYAPTFGSDPLNINPRIGFAWDPTGNGLTAIRGGFGMYSSPSPGVVIDQSRSAFPDSIPLNLANFSTISTQGSVLFNLASRTIQTLNPYLDVTAPNSLNQLLPGTNAVEVLALDLYALRGSLSPSYPSLDLVLPAKNLQNPRSYQFGLTVERELPGGLTGSIAYVGTLGESLYRVLTPQQGLNRSLVQFANDVLPVVANAVTTGAVVFPFFSGVMLPPQPNPVANSFTVAPTLFDSNASSIYNSLQAQVHKSYSRGILFASAFTYSHSIDDASDFFDTAGSFALPQNSFNPSERASSGFDARLRSVTYFVWDLPIKSARWGGWQLSGIFTAQTGQPYTVNTVFEVNEDGNLTDRLQTTTGLIPGPPGNDRTQLQIAPGINPLALLAPIGSNGALGRNTFRAPGIEALDCALVKSFTFRERHKMIIRSEFFNALNRPNFGIPVRILEEPGFGGSFNTTVPARTVQVAVKYSF